MIWLMILLSSVQIKNLKGEGISRIEEGRGDDIKNHCLSYSLDKFHQCVRILLSYDLYSTACYSIQVIADNGRPPDVNL